MYIDFEAGAISIFRDRRHFEDLADCHLMIPRFVRLRRRNGSIVRLSTQVLRGCTWYGDILRWANKVVPTIRRFKREIRWTLALPVPFVEHKVGGRGFNRVWRQYEGRRYVE